MATRRFNTGVLSVLLSLFVPPLFILTIWLNLSGVLSGSLQACFPSLPWLGEVAAGLWLITLVASFTFAIRALVMGRGRGWAVAAIVYLIVMAPVLFIVFFFMVYGDPGPQGTYICPF